MRFYSLLSGKLFYRVLRYGSQAVLAGMLVDLQTHKVRRMKKICSSSNLFRNWCFSLQWLLRKQHPVPKLRSQIP